MRAAPDNYFVRIDVPSDAPPSGSHARPQNRFNDGSEKRRRRRRKRTNGRSVLLVLLLVAVSGWCLWANARPGGIPGTINGFIEHVRGNVQDVSEGGDMKAAVKYFSQQYEQNGSYPSPNEDELSAAGVGIGVNVTNCGGDAVVIHTLTISRLLLRGTDYGDARGNVACPTNFVNPSPWKAK